MLTHLNVIRSARVLDLFAGTGALGLEALSRDAQHVVFIANGRVAQQLINQNIEKLQAKDATTLRRNDATQLGAWPMAPFDLAFLDPPYGKGMGQSALPPRMRAAGWRRGLLWSGKRTLRCIHLRGSRGWIAANMAIRM